MPNLVYLDHLFSIATLIWKDSPLQEFFLILGCWTYILEWELFPETQLEWRVK